MGRNGQNNGAAVMSTDQVLSIKKMLAERDKWGRPVWSASAIARQYRAAGQFVSAETIRRINRGDTWGWLQDDAAAALKAEETPLTAAEKMAAAVSLRKLQNMLGQTVLDELTGEKEEGK